MRMIRYWKSKKGFALILVVALAGIIALLAASLVSLSQVESASNRYKTHLRTAKDNARASLNLALGDLQMFAGRDQTATALADGFRSPRDEDSNANSAPEDALNNRIYQPFWTGVWDNDPLTGDDPVWLVTRPQRTGMDFSPGVGGDLADPFVDPNDAGLTTEYVALVGPATAEFAGGLGSQADFNVAVPLESFQTDSALGIAGNATTGKYGYWIGDLGTKASYAVPHRLTDIGHDDYANNLTNGSQTRLAQMIGQTQTILEIAPELPPNAINIPLLVSDFQLRNSVPGASFLTQFTDYEAATPFQYSLPRIRQGFHDYTTLSRGVLIDSLNGGLKRDLTPRFFTLDLDPVIDTEILPHLNIAYASSTEPIPQRRIYDAVDVFPDNVVTTLINERRPRIGPVVTEFHINFAIYLDRTGANLNGRLEYNGSIELWNPYTGSLADPNDGSFTVDIIGFPSITANYLATDPDPDFSDSGTADLSSHVNTNAFSLSMATPLRAGQTRSYSGADTIVIDGIGTDTRVLDISSDISFNDPTPSNTADDSFEFRVTETFDPTIVIRNSNGEEIARYTIQDTYDAFPAGVFESVSPIGDASATFGYTWEREDPLLGGADWSDFDPRIEAIDATELNAFDSDPRSLVNISHFIQDSTTRILGYSDPFNVSHDVPVIELPRQELVSMAELQHADLSTGIRRQIGRSVADLGLATNYNRLFDEYFLSTIPQPGVGWNDGDPFANARMKPQRGVPLATLQNAGLNSAPMLMLQGAFNVNSTSIEAWIAVLKSIRIKSWTFHDGSGGTDSIDFASTAPEFQFAHYSQSAEETWEVDESQNIRESFRRGLRSLTDAQIDALAIEIVESIRTKIDNDGPYANLTEFIDSGDLDTAIFNAGLNDITILPGSPQFLNQATLLNSLAPFLTTRSDTFLIRAYGDSRNPSDENDIIARAYCEAIVQRLPDKHPSDGNPTQPMLATSTDVVDFGRQFQVIAFRWMSGEEI